MSTKMTKNLNSSSFKDVFSSFCDYVLHVVMTENEKIHYNLKKENFFIEENVTDGQYSFQIPGIEETTTITLKQSENLEQKKELPILNDANVFSTNALQKIFTILSESILKSVVIVPTSANTEEKLNEKSISIIDNFNLNNLSVEEIDIVKSQVSLLDKNDLASAFKLIFSTLSTAMLNTMISDEDQMSYFMNDEESFIIGGPLINGAVSFKKKVKEEQPVLSLSVKSFTIEELLNIVFNGCREKIAEKSIKLVEPTISTSVSICGDFFRLIVVLSNLITHAVCFSPQGSTIVVVVSSNNGFVIFSVKHETVGITEMELKTLFFPEKAISPPKSELDMSLTRRVIEAHGGNCGCYYHNGNSELFFKIKYQEEYIEDLTDDEESAENAKNEVEKLEVDFEKFLEFFCDPDNVSDVAGCNILIIDDNLANCKSLKFLLTRSNYCVDICSNGVEALALVKNLRGSKYYDYVFMNPKLSTMDAFQTTKELRQLGYSNLIIGMMDQKCSNIDNLKFEESGADIVLKRSLDDVEYVAKLMMYYNCIGSKSLLNYKLSSVPSIKAWME